MIFLVVGPLIIGVLAGYALGGRFRNLVDTRIRHTWLLWLAAILQLTHFRAEGVRLNLEEWLGMSLMVPIFGLVGAWLVINLPGRTRAVRFAAITVLLGGAMNALVIAMNGRMPYSEHAVKLAHESAAQLAKGARSPKHVAADASTQLPWLGDVIPVPPIHMVISLGDVLLLAGAAALIAGAMCGISPVRRRGWVPRWEPSAPA